MSELWTSPLIFLSSVSHLPSLWNFPLLPQRYFSILTSHLPIEIFISAIMVFISTGPVLFFESYFIEKQQGKLISYLFEHIDSDLEVFLFLHYFSFLLLSSACWFWSLSFLLEVLLRCLLIIDCLLLWKMGHKIDLKLWAHGRDLIWSFTVGWSARSFVGEPPVSVALFASPLTDQILQKNVLIICSEGR